MQFLVLIRGNEGSVLPPAQEVALVRESYEQLANLTPASARNQAAPSGVSVAVPSPPMDDALRLRGEVLEFALGLPEAWEDHPWGDMVVKVRKRIFVFAGTDDPDGSPGMGLKLAMFHEQALSVPGAAPSGYGLGRSGWVSIPLGPGAPPLEILQDWVVESYRLVAPRRLGDQLGANA